MKGMKPLDKKFEHVLALLYNRVKHHLDEKSCFPWDENIESFLRENGVEDPYEFLADLVQMDVLKEPCGKQDQYVGSFGSLINIKITPKGKATISPINISHENLQKLDLRRNALTTFPTSVITLILLQDSKLQGNKKCF